MRTVEVIRKTKAFRDDFGNDIVDTTKLNNKKDCLDVLESHRNWLEAASDEALKGIDSFIRELGIEFEADQLKEILTGGRNGRE